MKRILAIILVILMLLGMVYYAMAEETEKTDIKKQETTIEANGDEAGEEKEEGISLNEDKISEETSNDNGMTLEESGFEFLDSYPLNNAYTPLALDGIEHPIFAFEDKDGLTSFRAYGIYDNRKGYYPIDVFYENGKFSLYLLEEKSVKEFASNMARATMLKSLKDLPENWYTDFQKMTYYYIDVFGNKFSFKPGQYRDGEVSLIPVAKNGAFIQGALPIDPDGIAESIKKEAYNLKLPVEYKRGYQKSVFIYTSNAQRVSVKTYYPELELDGIEPDTNIEDLSRSRIGNDGPEYTAIQKLYTELKYYAGEIDGIYGEGMIKATELFQQENGIKVTGKLDKATLSLLYFGDPVENPNPVKAEDFEGNGVGGEKYQSGYLDDLD